MSRFLLLAEYSKAKGLLCVPVDVTDTLRCFRETLEKSKYHNRSIRHSRKLLSLFLAQTQGKNMVVAKHLWGIGSRTPSGYPTRGMHESHTVSPQDSVSVEVESRPVLTLHPFLGIGRNWGWGGEPPFGFLPPPCTSPLPAALALVFSSSGWHLSFSHCVPTKALSHASALMPSVKSAYSLELLDTMFVNF